MSLLFIYFSYIKKWGKIFKSTKINLYKLIIYNFNIISLFILLYNILLFYIIIIDALQFI